MTSTTKSILGGFLLLCSVFIISCDNELELFGEIQERPVVYGLLSSSETVQYIRLERSFADEETAAVVLAQDENAVYFDDVTVFVTAPDGVRYEFERVNGVDEGYVRRPGDFLQDPNYLYKGPVELDDLEEGGTYLLEVVRDESVIATSSTVALMNADIESPNFFTRRLSFVPDATTRVRWQRQPNASSYAVNFDFIISEKDLNTNETTEIPLRWDVSNLITSLSGEGSETFTIEGEEFFNFLVDNFEQKLDVERRIEKIDVRVTSFGSEIGSYLDVINANSGITSAQEVPSFTNVEGGLGLFSSINETVTPDLVLSEKSLEELTEGSITLGLSFVE